MRYLVVVEYSVVYVRRYCSPFLSMFFKVLDVDVVESC